MTSLGILVQHNNGDQASMAMLQYGLAIRPTANGYDRQWQTQNTRDTFVWVWKILKVHQLDCLLIFAQHENVIGALLLRTNRRGPFHFSIEQRRGTMRRNPVAFRTTPKHLQMCWKNCSRTFKISQRHGTESYFKDQMSTWWFRRKLWLKWTPLQRWHWGCVWFLIEECVRRFWQMCICKKPSSGTTKITDRVDKSRKPFDHKKSWGLLRCSTSWLPCPSCGGRNIVHEKCDWFLQLGKTIHILMKQIGLFLGAC